MDERLAFSEELEEFDLLSSEDKPPVPSSPTSARDFDSARLKTDLSTTARAFNTRIQRKKKLQEEAQGEAERASRLRRSVMFRALVNIRKSLKEVVRIDLGERFYFSLEADDWGGWPRFTVRLVDSSLAKSEFTPLSVTAHDRNDSGTIELVYNEELSVERIFLNKDTDLERLPKTLKKCVRNYLDCVGDIVLAAENAEDGSKEDNYIEKKELSSFSEQLAAKRSNIDAENLFEESYTDNLLDTLPSLGEIESLPDLREGKPSREPTEE